MMKRLLLILSVTATSLVSAQTKDSIRLESGYAKQVYYSLENGEQARVDLASWDLAFGTSPQGSAIRFNGTQGAELYVYPNGVVSDWETIDTTGISLWESLHDSDTAWSVTAFNKVTANAFDLGWGQYSLITHVVSGDSIYLTKTANGTYKKFYIEKLQSGVYHLVHADLNGDNQETTMISKADFTGKNHGYYAFESNTVLDLEPFADSWDLVFTKYLADYFGDGSLFYGVTGVLMNNGVEVANVVDGSGINEIDTFGHNFVFDTKINAIGYDWKTYNFGAEIYMITPSNVYVIKDVDGKNWNFEFLDFSSDDGTFVFQFLDQSVVGLFGFAEQSSGLELYPNPILAGDRLSIETRNQDAILSVEVLDPQGHKVLQLTEGETSVPTSDLATGWYMVSITTAQGVYSESLIVE